MLDSLDALDKARERKFSTRSEAARYAAQIRWGNRASGSSAGENATAGGSPPLSPLGSRCKDAMDRHTEAGFTAEVINGKDWTLEKRQQLIDEWDASIAPLLEGESLDARQRNNIGRKSLLYMGRGSNDTLIVLRHESGAIAGVTNLVQNRQTGTLKIDHAASTGIMKGTGSALFGHTVAHASSSGATGLRLFALETAVSFWETVGFVKAGFDDSLTIMGMPSNVFSGLARELG